MQAVIDLKNDMNVPVSKGDEAGSAASLPKKMDEEDDDEDEESQKRRMRYERNHI